ncbi:MAG: sugar ABC transporter permease [Clostridiales bacterium]|uniref:Carbohydrate ABC transporter membrane protein 1 (CUT1 family) n=1 Tax=Harryflintia acetispora TaxID=1849041 RepID=A0A9X8UJU7_9FIRM|nr:MULTISPECIES: sugar ABC transporter permease [Oscillospiraceae]PWM38663.1 MAG: sugar ABC transporter permease [Clostridiales bacterium]RGB68291.1 sugar ABC transporter permease [Harryflintia acetispora]TCL43773.1 carbohydrate ABC transporter membrane protein 1 (CUT1 family) [Harryflintia acetispora]
MRAKKYTPFLYIIPALAILLVFVYVPIILNFFWSLFQWNAFTPGMNWVGLDYYARLFQDENFWICLKNNSLYAFISLFGQVGFGLVIAAILESQFMRRYSGFFRTVYFIPSIMSMTVVGLLFYLFYNPNVGPFNTIVHALTGMDTTALDILGTPETAIFGVIAVSQWMWFGYMAMLLIIGIQKIPDELNEAAVIDGANQVQIFWHVTIPNIKEMILVDTIVCVVGSFKLFDEVYIMTRGGPGYSSEVLAGYIYKAAFRQDEMGYACTIAVILFIITFILSLLQMKVSGSGKE